MTLLIGWVSADDKPKGKRISALYLASDSRFSWSTPNSSRILGLTDFGKKIYTANFLPEIFGFCGDVNLATHIIVGLVSLIDRNVFFLADDTLESKVAKVYEYIARINEEYPKYPKGSCVILYGTKVEYTFRMVKFTISNNVLMETINLPNSSRVVIFEGSGKDEFRNQWILTDHFKSNEHNLSRGVYHCLSKTIETIGVNDVGGVPQLAGIYRGLNIPRTFGIIKNNKRYLEGREYMWQNALLSNVEWRNDNFERIDPYSLRLMEGAQPQPFAD